MEQLLGKLTVMLPLLPLLYVAASYAAAYSLVVVVVEDDVVLELQLVSRVSTSKAGTARQAEGIR